MDWTNILIQIPIVAAFMWFVLEMDKRGKQREKAWMDFIKAERETSAANMQRIADSLDAISDKLEIHDRKTDLAVTRMEERTAKK